MADTAKLLTLTTRYPLGILNFLQEKTASSHIFYFFKIKIPE